MKRAKRNQDDKINIAKLYVGICSSKKDNNILEKIIILEEATFQPNIIQGEKVRIYATLDDNPEYYYVKSDGSVFIPNSASPYFPSCKFNLITQLKNIKETILTSIKIFKNDVPVFYNSCKPVFDFYQQIADYIISAENNDMQVTYPLGYIRDVLADRIIDFYKLAFVSTKKGSKTDIPPYGSERVALQSRAGFRVIEGINNKTK